MRVSTAYLNKQALEQVQDANARLGDLSYQISTGLKARNFQDIATDVNAILNLQDLKLNTEAYVSNIDTSIARLRAMENSLQGMADLLTEAASLWTLARNENSAEVRATMAPKAEGLTESFYNIFKTKFDGRFVFSGQNGSQAPITATPAPNTFPGDPPPTTYYTGDTALPQVVTGPSSTDTYGIAGDADAFAKMKAGLEALWYGLENNSVTDIDGAINLLQGAQEGISDALGEIGGQINGFDLVKERHESNADFLQDRIDGLEKVDITEALTQYSQEEATLQASLLITSRINQLSLLDFI